MDKLIDVGQIVNTHGLRGEVKINPWTDAPEVFEAFDTFYLKDGSAYKVQGVRYQKSCVLAKLEGISDKWSLKTVWGVGYKFDTAN